jgi:hypothetical protein
LPRNEWLGKKRHARVTNFDASHRSTLHFSQSTHIETLTSTTANASITCTFLFITSSINMAETLEDVQMDTEEIELETPASDVYLAPSVWKSDMLSGKSYSHFSPIPTLIKEDMGTECVLGVDEAGRGPVLGILKQPTVNALTGP